jgi:hypothetical protein
LPPGYTLDQAPSTAPTNTTAAVPPLPAGYSLDQAKAGGEHGYAYAPPEEKPPPAAPTPVLDDYGRPIPTTPLNLDLSLPAQHPADLELGNAMGDQGGSGGSPLPNTGSLAQPPPAQIAKTVLALPENLTPEQRKQIAATTPLERIIGAAHQGAVETPDASGWAPGGLQLGRYIVNPLLEAGGAALRGGLQFLGEAAGGDPLLTRDIQALPEAFPTGDAGLVKGPGSYTAARAGAERGNLQIRAASPPPVSLNELSGAIDRVPPEPPRVNQLAPWPSEPQPALAPEAPAVEAPQPTTATPQPGVAAQPTHIYQGPEYDQPVTPTGNE